MVRNLLTRNRTDFLPRLHILNFELGYRIGSLDQLLSTSVPGPTDWMVKHLREKLKTHRESQKRTRADSIIQMHHPPTNPPKHNSPKLIMSTSISKTVVRLLILSDSVYQVDICGRVLWEVSTTPRFNLIWEYDMFQDLSLTIFLGYSSQSRKD